MVLSAFATVLDVNAKLEDGSWLLVLEFRSVLSFWRLLSRVLNHFSVICYTDLFGQRNLLPNLENSASNNPVLTNH